MFTLKEHPNLSEALDIFVAKMTRMGIPVRKTYQDSAYRLRIDGHDNLRAQRGVGRVLSQFLSYCYEVHIDFDHNGKEVTGDRYERPALDKYDGIMNMYNRWESACLQKENT